MLSTEQKESYFLSASKFAVVGASRDASKFGAKVFHWYLSTSRDVVPINPKADKIQGVSSLRSIFQLPDPKNTAISIVTPPTVTFRIIQEARMLGVRALWLQPGSEDARIVQWIESSGMEDRIIYAQPHAIAETSPSNVSSSFSSSVPEIGSFNTLVQLPGSIHSDSTLVNGPCGAFGVINVGDHFDHGKLRKTQQEQAPSQTLDVSAPAFHSNNLEVPELDSDGGSTQSNTPLLTPEFHALDLPAIHDPCILADGDAIHPITEAHEKQKN